MGLIKAVSESAFSYIHDMWEDYIYCDAMDRTVLVKKGHARSSAGVGKKANDNVITEGSRIAVNAGQMLIVVENGRIIDFTAEQGGYMYYSQTEPSLFCGEFGENIKTTFEQLKTRFSFGGQASNDQRVYFINTKEIMNNRFGFGNVPYREAEFNMTIHLKGYGTYSFKIVDPLLFYSNVSGNVSEAFKTEQIEALLKSEMQHAMLPVFAKLAKEKICYDALALKIDDFMLALKEELSSEWKNKRGIEIQSVAFHSISPDEESVDKIRELQESRVYSDNKAMLGARVGAAQANAMEAAAENPSGAVNGFMGLHMAQQAGGVNVSEFLKEDTMKTPMTQKNAAKKSEPVSKAADSTDKNQWICSCGMVNYMAFCPQCGLKRPEKKVCQSCGYEVTGNLSIYNFCPKCGQKF